MHVVSLRTTVRERRVGLERLIRYFARSGQLSTCSNGSVKVGLYPVTIGKQSSACVTSGLWEQEGKIYAARHLSRMEKSGL